MKKKYLVYEILFSGAFLLMANFSCYFIILILYQTLIQKEKKIYIYIYMPRFEFPFMIMRPRARAKHADFRQ